MLIKQYSTPTVRPGYSTDIFPVADNVRQSDWMELRDGVGLEPRVALYRCFQVSSRSWTIEYDKVPVSMFGVGAADGDDDFGIVWMMSTPQIDCVRKDLIRLSPFFINEVQRGYSTIGGLVDCRNENRLRWLMGLGFFIQEYITNTKSGVQFALMVRSVG